MKLLWLDLNSSYAHSSLALPALHAQIADDTTIEWCIVSATINENTGMVVSRIHQTPAGHHCRHQLVIQSRTVATHHIPC